MKVFQELFCNHVGCRQKIGISQAERGIQERGKNIERKPGSAQPSSKIGMGRAERDARETGWLRSQKPNSMPAPPYLS